MSARPRVHGHRVAAQRDRSGDALLRAARRDARDLANADHEPSRGGRRSFPVQPGRVLSLGRVGRPDELPAEPTRPARSRSAAASSTTRPSTESDGTISPTSPARRTVAGFDTQRETFLGPYRGWDRPLVVEQGRSEDSIAHGWAPIGSHHIELDARSRRDPGGRLRPRVRGEPARREVRSIRLAGTIDTRRVAPVIERYLRTDEVDAAFGRLREQWSDLLEGVQVHTPSEHTDRMVNVWNAYQCMVTFNLSRSASSFDTGVGRGMGFRDSSQDLLGFVHMVPERARERILDLAATQLPTGGAYHQYQPLTKRGNDAIGSGFNDDPLWLILAVAAYVKETGDREILDEPVPYDNEQGSETPLLRAPPPGARLHPRSARPARAAADRQSGLERLPQPQRLLGRAGRVVPDGTPARGRRGGVGVHRRAVRARGGGARAARGAARRSGGRAARSGRSVRG